MKNLSELTVIILIIVSIPFINDFAQQNLPSNVPVDNSQYFDKSETAIAADPNNANHLMASWNDYSEFIGAPYPKPGYAFSTDGGQSWFNISTIPIPPSSKYQYGYDPSCAIDKNGNEYYTFGTYDNSAIQGPIYIAMSNNNGSSWAVHQVSSSTQNQDKPYMAIDNDNNKIYVSWVSLIQGSNTINFAYSTDQGGSWYTPLTGILDQTSNMDPLSITSKSPLKHTAQLTTPLVQDPIPVAAGNNNVYVVWDETSGNGSIGYIKIKKSTDGGKHFYNVVNNGSSDILASISSAWDIEWGVLRMSSAPTIAVDPVSGNVCVAFTQYESNDLYIYCTVSTDGGNSWSTPKLLTGSTTDYQFFPSLSVGPEGVFS